MAKPSALVAEDCPRCTCCGLEAYVIDEDHGALCPECLEALIEIQAFLDAIDLQ